MVGENFEIYSSQIRKSVFKLSIIAGENFEIYLPQMDLKFPPSWLDKILKFGLIKCVKMYSNCSPCLEKILKFTFLKCLKKY